MPRALVLNNYPLRELWREADRGETPDQLLFGINHLARAGWSVTFAPEDDNGAGRILSAWLQRLRFPIPVGDLQQQRHALRALDKCDVIYAASQSQTEGLSYLRALGLVRRPIVCLAHHPVNRGRLMPLREPFLKWQLRGTDAFPSLSRGVACQINALAPGKSAALPWGPDARFYQPAASAGIGVLAVGRTGRDFETFGRGATLTRAPAQIICLERHVTAAFAGFGPNVTVTTQPDRGWMSYRALVPHLASARAIAIPLAPQDSLAGLSSLADALGMGKPVLMTRHPLVDIDIEAERIGRWIEPGDVDGWREAVRWVDTHPDEAAAMGARARQLVDDGLNSESFGRSLLAIVAKAARA